MCEVQHSLDDGEPVGTDAWAERGRIVAAIVVHRNVPVKGLREGLPMFRKPKPNMIESDTGFSVEQVDFSNLAYREGDKTVTLTIEHLVGPAIFVVYLGGYTDRWDPPFDTVIIGNGEWRKIGDNIRDAYRSQGFQIEVDIRSMSPEEREAFKRALEELKRPPATPLTGAVRRIAQACLGAVEAYPMVALGDDGALTCQAFVGWAVPTNHRDRPDDEWWA